MNPDPMPFTAPAPTPGYEDEQILGIPTHQALFLHLHEDPSAAELVVHRPYSDDNPAPAALTGVECWQLSPTGPTAVNLQFVTGIGISLAYADFDNRCRLAPEQDPDPANPDPDRPQHEDMVDHQWTALPISDLDDDEFRELAPLTPLQRAKLLKPDHFILPDQDFENYDPPS